MATARIQFLSPATGYIELSQDIVVPLSFGLGDIRDISKRAGAFSKSIVIPGTKQNKDILSHLYDLNIVTGTFDVNKLQKCIILDEAGSILFNNGIVQLIDVNKSNSTFTNEEEISFTLLVKDTTGDFFTSMGNKELKKLKQDDGGLDFSEFNHRFDQQNVVESWEHTYVDGYKYLMPYINPIGEVTDHIFHLTEFRPAIYARQYWDKIFAANGYSYTWDSQDSQDIQFSKLVIPYNGDVPKLNQTSADYQTVITTGSSITDYTLWTSTTGEVNLTTSLPYVVDQLFPIGEELDNLGQFNIGTSIFTSTYDAQTPGGINFIYEIDYDFIITVPGISPVTLNNTVAGNDSEFVLINSIFNQTVGGSPTNAPINSISVSDGTVLTVGDNIIYSNSVIGSNVVGNVNAFNTFLLAIGLGTPSTNATWVDSIGDTVFGVQYKISINSLRIRIAPSVNTQAGYGSQYDLNQFVPEKVKQADFIKSICNMFNLFIIPDDDNPTNLIIKTRNEYYDEGAIFDATSILCKEREQIIEFLPDVTAKRITLTYKQDTDVANKGYYDNVNEIYGQVQYQFDSEYVKNNETKELIFSPTPNINNDAIGANLPYLSGAAPKTNLRILYDGGMLPTTNVGFKINEVGLIYSAGFTEYPFMGHFDRPVNPTYDLNYNQCDYYFYDNFNYITSNNLYNKFWKRTLDTMNDGKLVTAYFYLNSANIGQFKLNTKIYLKQYNKYFVINKIIDFNVNSKRPTKVELISYDENIKLRRGKGPKVPIKNPIKVPGPAVILNPIKEKWGDRFKLLNNDLTGTAQIKGFNNFVTVLGKEAIIVGSNNYINAPNAIVYSSSTIVELPNTNINGPTNQPPSSITLEEVLINGNTTGSNWIEVESGYGLESIDGTITDKLVLDPQAVGDGTSFSSEDSTTSKSAIFLTPSTSTIQNNDISFASYSSILEQTFGSNITSNKLESTNLGGTASSTIETKVNIVTDKSSIDLKSDDLNVNADKIKVIIGDQTLSGSINEQIGNAIVTTNATATVISSFTPSIRKVYEVEAVVRGIRTNWATACTFRIVGSFRVSALGVVTAFGSNFVVENNEFTTANVTLTTNGTDIIVTVIGEAATTINWASTVTSSIG